MCFGDATLLRRVRKNHSVHRRRDLLDELVYRGLVPHALLVQKAFALVVVEDVEIGVPVHGTRAFTGGAAAAGFATASSC